MMLTSYYTVPDIITPSWVCCQIWGGEFLFSNLLSCKILRYHYLYMMKKIPEKIEEIFCRRMQKAGVAYPLQQEYRKWLRYYLDFCSKYYLNPTDRETPQQFMQKLNEKGQSADKQKQAYQSVKVYLDIVANEKKHDDNQKFRDGNEVKTLNVASSDKTLDSGSEPGRWSAIFNRLRETVRLRNYSKKTFRTYASWINRFAWFVKHKDPDDVLIRNRFSGGTGTRPPACACPHADRLEPV